MTDLEKMGLVGGDKETNENILPEEMMNEEFLDSPLGMVMQALAGLEMAAKSFNARLDQMEQYMMYLLAKDPHMGPKVAAIMQATKNKDQTTEGTTSNVQHAEQI